MRIFKPLQFSFFIAFLCDNTLSFSSRRNYASPCSSLTTNLSINDRKCSKISFSTRRRPVSSSSAVRMINNSKPGDEWRQSRGTGYVPLGLTAEEYKKIKAKERKSLQSKNLGMWGPRFSQSSRPDGDWMVQPKLWTQGFNSQRTNLQSSTSNGANGEGAVVDKDMSNLKAWIRFGKKHYPAFIALYFTLQSIQVALVLSRYFLFNTFKETTFSSGPLSIVSAVKLAFLGIFQSTYFRQNILGSCASWKLASFKSIIAVCFAVSSIYPIASINSCIIHITQKYIHTSYYVFVFTP